MIATDCVSGPREILCPNIYHNSKITYPYYGKYGILVQNFDNIDINKLLKKHKLYKQEEMLANVMIKMVKEKSLRGKYSHGIDRAKDFNKDKILKYWLKIV